MAKSFQEQLRDEIRRANKAGITTRRICQGIGLDEATMSRFVNKRGGLSMECLDRLFQFLGLRIVTTKLKRRKE